VLNLQTHATIAGAIFLAFVVFAMDGNGLPASGANANPANLEAPAKLLFFALTAAFGAAAVPLPIELFVIPQASLGKSERPFVARRLRRERGRSPLPCRGLRACLLERSTDPRTPRTANDVRCR
jgi:hypothetical protein